MLRNQGVRAVFRVFWGGILLLGANAAVAQTVSVSPAASDAVPGDEITFSGSFPSSEVGTGSNLEYRIFRCNTDRNVTPHTNLTGATRGGFGDTANCTIISTAGMNGFGMNKSRTLPSGSDAPKYTLVVADFNKHLYFAASTASIFAVAPVYSPPALPPITLGAPGDSTDAGTNVTVNIYDRSGLTTSNDSFILYYCRTETPTRSDFVVGVVCQPLTVAAGFAPAEGSWSSSAMPIKVTIPPESINLYLALAYEKSSNIGYTNTYGPITLPATGGNLMLSVPGGNAVIGADITASLSGLPGAVGGSYSSASGNYLARLFRCPSNIMTLPTNSENMVDTNACPVLRIRSTISNTRTSSTSSSTVQPGEVVFAQLRSFRGDKPLRLISNRLGPFRAPISSSVSGPSPFYFGNVITTRVENLPAGVTAVSFRYEVCPTSTYDDNNCPDIVTALGAPTNGVATSRLTVNPMVNNKAIPENHHVFVSVSTTGSETFTAQDSVGPVTIPPVPANLATAPSFGTATSSGLPLSWTKPNGATGFKVYADTNANFTADTNSLIKTLDLDADADGADCASDGDGDCAYTIPHADLTAGADNYFRVVPTNIGGDAMMPSAVSVAWASPAVLLAPTSGLTATFIAGTSEGSWQAPTGSGGLGDLAYGFDGTNLPEWLVSDDATRTLSVSGTVESTTQARNLTPTIAYTVTDSGGRDAPQTAQITLRIELPGPLSFAADIRAGAQNYDTGATVEIFSLGNASGGSGGSRTYTLGKIGGSAADLAALGLEAVAGSPLAVLANTGDGDAVSYQTATPISIRSIADTPTRAGSITLRYGVSDSAGAAPTHYDFAITVGSPPPAAASGGGGGSGAIVALVLAGGAYFWWKKRQIASGNAAKMAVLPDVSFDLDRNDRRAFFTKMNWQNSGNSNWQIRSNLQIHTKYSGKLLDWNANSHIGYRLNGKFGDFNPYLRGKFVQNAPENAKMDEIYTLGVNYAIPNRFSAQFLQPDDEIWRYSLKTEMHLPKGISLRFNQPNSDIWRYSANLNWQISERIGLNLSQPNNDLPNYGFGIQWRGKSQIRYGLHGETGRNSYRFTGSYTF